MAKKKKKNKDPLYIDNLIAMCKKEGNDEMAERFEEIKAVNKELRKVRAGAVITFEELVNLPEGYKYVSNCSGNVDIEEMCQLEVKDEIISWSQSTGDPRIEMGTGDVRDVPHCSDDEYCFTLYHILPKKTKTKK